MALGLLWQRAGVHLQQVVGQLQPQVPDRAPSRFKCSRSWGCEYQANKLTAHLHVEVLPQLGVVQHQDALNNDHVSRLHLANLCNTSMYVCTGCRREKCVKVPSKMITSAASTLPTYGYCGIVGWVGRGGGGLIYCVTPVCNFVSIATEIRCGHFHALLLSHIRYHSVISCTHLVLFAAMGHKVVDRHLHALARLELQDAVQQRLAVKGAGSIKVVVADLRGLRTNNLD